MLLVICTRWWLGLCPPGKATFHSPLEWICCSAAADVGEAGRELDLGWGPEGTLEEFPGGIKGVLSGLGEAGEPCWSAIIRVLRASELANRVSRRGRIQWLRLGRLAPCKFSVEWARFGERGQHHGGD